MRKATITTTTISSKSRHPTFRILVNDSYVVTAADIREANWTVVIITKALEAAGCEVTEVRS